MGVIYKITNPNGRLYVGKTYNLRKRINVHKNAAKKDSNIILYCSIKKYGWDAHKLEIIEECADELMDEREIFWIAELKTYCYDYPGQMNMTKGGEGQRSTWKHDKGRIEALSKRMTGDGNPFYGKKHSDEFKEWMSEYAKERNKKNGTKVPKWGCEKGRLAVIVPTLVYDRYGVLIKDFESLSDAAKFTKQSTRSIYKVCSGERTNAGGFIFRFKDGEVLPKIEVGEIKKQTVKRPVYSLNDDLEVIFEFTSAQEASGFWGIPKGTINRAAKYNDLKPIKTGHIFCYEDEYLEEYCLVA